LDQKVALIPAGIGDWVREARRGRGLSLERAAQAAGVSIQSLWDLEARGSGTLRILEAIAPVVDLRIAGLPPGKSLSSKIRTARLRTGKSLAEVATKAGVSVGAVRSLESGPSARVATFWAVARVVAPRMRPRKHEVARFENGKRDERLTSSAVFEKVVAAIGRSEFDLDPCGHPLSPVRAGSFFYEADDGLTQPWRGAVFINPPYAAVSKWIEKGYREWKAGRCSPVVMLLPNQSLHSLAFHDFIVGAATVFLLRTRIAFYNPNRPAVKGLAPFGNFIAVFGCDSQIEDRMLANFFAVAVPPTARVSRPVVARPKATE
jgi:transcriptional regulator with XRE-family HTH domain